MTSKGNVEYLDTNKFNDTILIFRSGIEEYNTIKSNIEKTTNHLLTKWKGEGQKQFERDYTIIYKQLDDLGDILYELQDAIIEAQVEYLKTDTKVAKMLTI